MTEKETKIKLEKVFDTLSSYLGDTEPHIEEDMNDDEIRHEYPIFWSSVEIMSVIKQL